MSEERIEQFIMTNCKYLPSDKVFVIKEKLRTVDSRKADLLFTVDFKDPIIMLIISIFLGSLGVDRFILGDIGMGILKLLTAGCCGILYIIDIILISDKTKEYNFRKLMELF